MCLDRQTELAGRQEAARLTADNAIDINAALVHVSKPGGFLSSTLRPIPRSIVDKKVDSDQSKAYAAGKYSPFPL